MRSAHKIFKGTSGFEDVLSRANAFVTRVGRENLIGVNTLIDSSETQRAGIGSRVSRGTSAEEVIVVVWYWDATESS
jgi:hypothetical protein